ncbi:hypothetical protein NPX13_g10653 [Xylaria arbuscula]|uniref:Membrane protein TMS1 n=1 Tax=Xylaria arbuscula TaxID=114810 RepID=A0A9W8THQ0_9PEZI|nr:hypothetical protein NPX13_g10653 [Xylaria arbuscula]
MGALLSIPLLAVPSVGTIMSVAASCCGAATCSMVCSACGKCGNSVATRIAYALLLLVNSVLSWIMLTPWAIEKLQHLTLDYVKINCPTGQCYGWLAVHRINFALGLFHLIFAGLLFGVTSSKNPRAALQNGYWGQDHCLDRIHRSFLPHPRPGDCAMNQAAITINLLFWLAISFISVHPAVQEYNPKAGLAQAAMVAVYCTYLTMSAVSMEPDDKHCNPLIRAQGTRTTSVVIGAIVTMLTVAYTTTRAATQSLGLGNNKGGIRLPDDDDEHNLVTQQPGRREMRAEVLRRAVEEGSLPADALLSDDDDDDDEGSSKTPHDDERGHTQYDYSVFHIIFFLATCWVASLLTSYSEGDGSTDGEFATVGRTYWASWVKIISAWFCYCLYIWTLVAPVILPERFDS